MLSQNNHSNISKFKIDLRRKSIKFELMLLIFNDNKIINIVNTNFNMFKLNALNSKTCEIKNIIDNFHLILFSIRYNALKFRFSI